VAYSVAWGNDEGAEEAAVLGGLDADALENEGVVKVEPRRGGARDFLRRGGGLEASAHRFRVHGRRRAGPARRMEVTGIRRAVDRQTRRHGNSSPRRMGCGAWLGLLVLTGGVMNG
jgi:hypothetical protein